MFEIADTSDMPTLCVVAVVVVEVKLKTLSIGSFAGGDKGNDGVGRGVSDNVSRPVDSNAVVDAESLIDAVVKAQRISLSQHRVLHIEKQLLNEVITELEVIHATLSTRTHHSCPVVCIQKQSENREQIPRGYCP